MVVLPKKDKISDYKLIVDNVFDLFEKQFDLLQEMDAEDKKQIENYIVLAMQKRSKVREYLFSSGTEAEESEAVDKLHNSLITEK